MSRLSEIMRRVNRSKLYGKPGPPRRRSVVGGVLPVLSLLVIVGVISLVGLHLPGSGVGLGRMTFEEVRHKALGLNEQLLSGPEPSEMPNMVVEITRLLGPPVKEQVVGDTYYLYYRAREGRAQVVVVGGILMRENRGVQGAVNAVNLY